MATPSIPIETIAAANRAIEAGATLTEAAKRQGISRRALCNARARAKALARGAAVAAPSAPAGTSDNSPPWTSLESSEDISAARAWTAQALVAGRISPAVAGALTRLVSDAERSAPPPSQDRDVVEIDEVAILLRGIAVRLWGTPARELVLDEIRRRAPGLAPVIEVRAEPQPPRAAPPPPGAPSGENGYRGANRFATPPPRPTEPAPVERAEVAPPPPPAPPTPPSPAPPPRAPAVEAAPRTPPAPYSEIANGSGLVVCPGCGRGSSRAHVVACARR